MVYLELGILYLNNYKSKVYKYKVNETEIQYNYNCQIDGA